MSAESAQAPFFFEAYSQAWARRIESGDPSLDLLRSEVDSVVVGELDSDLWEVYSSFWERRVPPSKLGREFSRMGLRTLAEVVRATFSLLRSAPREPRWMKEPSNVEMLRGAPEFWRLPLSEVPISVEETDREWVVRACEATELDEGEVVYDFDVWLDPSDVDSNLCTVMLGRRRVGSTRVPHDRKDLLQRLAAKRVFVDGGLQVDVTQDPPSLRLGVALPPTGADLHED